MVISAISTILLYSDKLLANEVRPETQALQTKKQLILIVIAAFSALCSTCYALEDSFALMFVLTAGKSLIARQSFIEVTSTEVIYIQEANVLPLSDTQCLYTETPAEQVCFGNNRPTRIRLLPNAPLTIGFHPLGLSLVEYALLPTPVTALLFPGQDALPEFYPAIKAIAAELQQSARRQREITEAAKQWHLAISLISDNKSLDWLKEDIDEDCEVIEGWRLDEQEPGMDDRNMARVRFDGRIHIEPGIRYCFFSDFNSWDQNDCQMLADSNGGSNDDSKKDSGSNSDSSSGESGDGKSEEPEKKSDADLDVVCTGVSKDPIPKELHDFYIKLETKRIKTEPPSCEALFSDEQVPAHKEIVVTTSLSVKRKSPTPSGKKPYKCQHPACGRTFTWNSRFQRHLRSHTGEKPYQCEICSRLFSDGSSLAKHLHIHTGEKPYTCQTCNKTFSRKDGLERHLRTHTGEKPYQCEACNKTFSDLSGLTKHERTHTGERPYKCQICGKPFARGDALQVHLRIHTGEKPYKCKKCGMAFSDRSSLIRHLRIHIGKKPKRKR